MRFFLILALILTSPKAVMTNTNQAVSNPTNPATSQELNSLTAKRTELQAERNSLTGKQDFWHGWVIGLTVLAATVGVFAGAAAMKESKRSYALRDVDSRLSDTEAQIDDWNKTDAEWNIGKLEKETESLRAQNLEAQTTLNISNEHLLKLERETGWRRIDVLEVANNLKRFAGTQYMVRYLNDPECFALMDAISVALQDAGWKPTFQQRIPLDNKGFSQGVEINFAHVPQLEPKDSEVTVEAGTALWKTLATQPSKEESIGVSMAGVTDLSKPENGTVAPASGPGTPSGLNVVVISIGWRW